MSLRVKQDSGVALLEVLITLLVLAIGMMGIASMLFFAHKASSSSYIKQQAIQSAYNIIDRMRANRDAAINGSYNVSNIVSSGNVSVPSAPSADCSTSSCSPTQLAAYDTWYWQAKDLTQLPGGCGSIATAPAATGGNTAVTVTVQWDDSPTQNLLGATSSTAAGNANLAQFIVGTLL